MKRVVVVAGFCCSSVGAVVAQQELANQAQTVMKATGTGMGRARADGQGREAL